MKFSIQKYFDIRIFLASFALGIFFVYITYNENRKVYVYPSPENANLIQYKDNADQCFEFQETPTQCSNDKQQTFQIKPQ